MSTLSETDIFQKAIKHWWASKKSAAPRKTQGGTRDANLHGKTMDGFAATLRDFLLGLKVKSEHIFVGGHLTHAPSILPSYFRPSKNWDLTLNFLRSLKAQILAHYPGAKVKPGSIASRI